MAADVGQRFAHDLIHDLALRLGEHLLCATAGDLDADRVEVGELLGLLSQVGQQPAGTDRARPQLSQRLTDLLEHALEDFEHVTQAGVHVLGTLLQIDLEEGDRRRQVSGQAVVQLAGLARPLARDRVIDRLMHRGGVKDRGRLLRLGHGRTPIRRRR